MSVTEQGLESLEANRDQVVWELATKIYSQSGHKVQLCTARDVVNSRIGVMKFQLAQARQAAIEANQIAREEAHRAAEEKARRIAREEAHRSAEEEARLRERQNKAARILGVLGEDEGKAKVFVRVQKILSEQLDVDENEVNLDSHIVNDLGADSVYELIMALEEEFDIEITDDSDWTVTACEVKQVVDLIYAKLSA